jgi:hypothetical protein
MPSCRRARIFGGDTQELLHHVEHALVRDLALEVAAERGHDAGALQRDVVLFVKPDSLVRLRDVVFHRALLVAREELRRGGQRERAFDVQPLGGQRAQQTFRVQPERSVVDSGPAIVAPHDFVGIGPSRDAVRVHEGGNLDVVEPGVR